MITLEESVSKSFGSRTLFELEGSITFTAGNRYGLTGPNGAGKSTLLRAIIGQEELTTGRISRPKKIGYLRQDIEAYRDYRAIDVVIMGNERLWEAMSERDALYEQEITDEVGMRLGELEEVVAEEDGYSAESKAEILLEGIGIPAEDYETVMSQLPTDFQFRVLLCQALFGEPQALLLDEPTNHLDLTSISWLEGFLSDYTGTVIVVSHDRHFLNTVTTHIADIDYDTIITYPGNYDQMVAAKSSVRARAEAQAKSKENKVQKLKEFVAKFSAGSRASQVQSRLREINRLEPQALKQSNIQRPYIRFIPTEKKPGKVVLKAEALSKGYELAPGVIKDLDLEVTREDKIGIIGANGMGKTTLLKMLVGALTPDSGSIEEGHEVKIAYFPQNHKEVVDKSSEDNVLEWLQKRHTGIYEQEVRSALGKMLFSGDDAFKQVKSLSGGETARLILASMMLQDHNVLILDEPNNHLDLEAVSALAWGLAEYKGTVIVVSHDRDLISTVANRLVVLGKDNAELYSGKLEDYLASKK